MQQAPMRRLRCAPSALRCVHYPLPTQLLRSAQSPTLGSGANSHSPYIPGVPGCNVDALVARRQRPSMGRSSLRCLQRAREPHQQETPAWLLSPCGAA